MLLVMLLLCASSNCAETQPIPDHVDVGIVDDLDQRLAAARELWAAKQFTTYTFRLERTCFCNPRRMLATVHVGDGHVAFVDDVQGDGVPMEPVMHGQPLAFFTIEELFDMIERGDRRFRTARFDHTLGFPTQVGLGDASIDAGVAYRVLHLGPVEAK